MKPLIHSNFLKALVFSIAVLGQTSAGSETIFQLKGRLTLEAIAKGNMECLDHLGQSVLRQWLGNTAAVAPVDTSYDTSSLAGRSKDLYLYITYVTAEGCKLRLSSEGIQGRITATLTGNALRCGSLEGRRETTLATLPGNIIPYLYVKPESEAWPLDRAGNRRVAHARISKVSLASGTALRDGTIALINDDSKIASYYSINSLEYLACLKGLVVPR